MEENKIIVDEHILFYAFRYALGRRTYAVSDVASALIENWDKISESQKTVIKAHIVEAISGHEAGDNCDVNWWKKIMSMRSEKDLEEQK